MNSNVAGADLGKEGRVEVETRLLVDTLAWAAVGEAMTESDGNKETLLDG